MNRRKAILNILSIGSVAGISLSVFKFYEVKKAPCVSSISHYKELIAELAETIIPGTTTPGAKSANVEVFIINVITSCTTEKEQNNFINGLENLEDHCIKEYGKSFLKCNELEKNDVLAYFEKRDEYSINFFNKINNKIFGQSFFTKLRSLTVDGYCVSRVGSTAGLAYDYIPGSYQSCLKLAPGQKSWATK